MILELFASMEYITPSSIFFTPFPVKAQPNPDTVPYALQGSLVEIIAVEGAPNTPELWL